MQTTPFCFINWQFYHVRCKTIETLIFTVNVDSLPGPSIIGTFEKRAPGLPNTYPQGSDLSGG